MSHGLCRRTIRDLVEGAWVTAPALHTDSGHAILQPA